MAVDLKNMLIHMPVKTIPTGFAGCMLAALAIVSSMNLAYASDSASIWQNDPILTTIAGERITELAIGQQAVIGITAQNLRATSQHIVVVLEVRDGNGFTEYLAWQGGVIGPNSEVEMQFSWTPSQTCEFYQDCEKREIRSFTITSIAEPAVLSPVSATRGITVSGIATEVPNLDERFGVLLHDRIYNAMYSFHKGSGRITDIAFDRDTRTLTLSVETLQDSQLITAIPKPLFDYTIIGATQQAVEHYVMVDGNDTRFTLLFGFKIGFVTYVMNIEEGTKEVTLGGRLQ